MATTKKHDDQKTAESQESADAKLAEQTITAKNDKGEEITLVCNFKPAEDASDPDAVPDKVKGFFNTLDSLANAALR
jgi:hypothetical protein